MNVTFNKRNKVVQEKMEMLAVELGVIGRASHKI
jgi:hypothetical protein